MAGRITSMPDSIIREMLAAHTAATTTSYLTLGHGEESISTVRPHDQQRSVPTVADASANGRSRMTRAVDQR